MKYLKHVDAALNIVRSETEKLFRYFNPANNSRKLGPEYPGLDYYQSLDFLNMTISGLMTQTKNH
jgi:hypothetical protein